MSNKTELIAENKALKELCNTLGEALKGIAPFVANDFPPIVALGKRSDAYTAAWREMTRAIESLKSNSDE